MARTFIHNFNAAKQCSKSAMWLMIGAYVLMLVYKLLVQADSSLTCNAVIPTYIFFTISAIILEIVSFAISFNAKLYKVRTFVANGYGIDIEKEIPDNYYDNDAENVGFCKVALNSYENCFFSKRISEKMIVDSVTKIVVISAIALFLVLFMEKQWALIILSLTYPITMIAKEVRFLYSIRVLDIIEKDFFSVYSKGNKQLSSRDKALLLSSIVRYEVTMASLGKELSSKVYNRLNDSITQEWNEMKEKKFKKQ